ncbi:MAG: cell division protein FtsL [Clostridia bacterium]|nr:cell division protein FtsL [Clostridia bacterium]
MSTANITYDYGFDFSKERKAKEVKAKKIEVRKGKANALTYILVIGILLLSVVVCSAFTANLKYENNQLIAENQEIQDEIDLLNVEIQAATNLTNIEKIARNKYGMEYADASQYVYIKDVKAPGKQFASTMKKEIFN